MFLPIATPFMAINDSNPDFFNCHAIHGVDECVHFLPRALAPDNRMGVKTPEKKNISPFPWHTFPMA
jgi:hypothetical protein